MGASTGIQIRPLGGIVQALSQYGANLFKPPGDTIRNIDADGWYSPLQPVEPMGPKNIEPRAFQYWWGQNLTWTPRFDAEYSAAQLRALSQYPLARVCIQNVTDSLIKANWEIQPKPAPGEPRKSATKRGIGDENLLKLNKFFERPDREHVWPDWLKPFLEDMLVIDAACLLVRKTFSGQVVEIPSIRGELIVRYIDENGFTPMPPQPAYAQNWWGIPLVNMTTDQCIYRPRNIIPGNTVSSMLYGTSPTQQAAPWIEIGIERLAFQLAYYKEGSIPGVVQVVPRGTSPDKIAEAMTWMNSELAGNLAARRQWRMVQGFNEPGKDDQILLTKEPLLTDAFDEDHINKICFSYGTSPQRLKKMMNRASAQASEESSDVEGMLPYFAWLKNSVIDHLIQRVMGYEDYEMVFNPVAEPNPEKKQVILSGYVHEGILRRNEARAQLGEEPVTDQPEADQLCVTTGSGAVPLGAPVVGTQPGEAAPEGSVGGKPGAKPPVQAQEGDDEPPPPARGKPNGSGKPNGKGLHAHTENRPIGFAAGTVIAEPQSLRHGLIEPANGLGKRKLKGKGTLAINPGKLFPQSILGKHLLERVLTKRFRGMQRKSVKAIAASLELPHHHLAKADDQDAVLNQILESLANDWQAIADSALDALPDAAQAGADNGGIQLDITDEGMLGGINEVARDWAQDRAAELVGMRQTDDGTFIPNPDAKWAISDTTRDKLRDIIKDVFEQEDEIAPGEHVTLRDIENRIEQSGIFSDVRASLIARTEIARAQTKGNLFSWQESGLVKSVNVVLSFDHDVEDSCDEAADGGPYPIMEAPDVPLHPACLCSLVLDEFEDGVE